MKYDLNILNDYIAKGLIEKNDHPSLPLSIYNYTRECQFLQVWDDITLECRGLVLDNEGNVVAKTFRKFFNMEEIPTSLIPNEPFEVFEKMDGSLGICFKYKGEFVLATRGSFTSDQAKKGTEIAKRYALDQIIVEGFTYLFEIIYPENRIVVDYGSEERLVLLGIIKTDTLEEIPYDEINFNGWDIVKKYNGINDYKTLKALIKDDQEGFIVRFKSGFRMKVKGAEYIRLHRLLTNFSNVDIWECLKKGEDINVLLERVPDEFDAWVRKCIDELNRKYIDIEFDAIDREKGLYETYPYEMDKKEYAEWVKTQPRNVQSILFSIYNKKDYSQIIWKQIRPTYQKPFWNKEDEG